MPSTFAIRYLLVLAIAALSLGVQAAQGRLGFTVSAETDGLFSTTLKRLKITAILPGAPAAHAGLQVGDEVEAINDVPVVGTSAARIADMVHAVQPGQHVRFKVLRSDAEHLVDIVAGDSR
ncbi:MAG: PDZ domain-containing protein [Betaproteobacteria bacterium]